MDFDSGKKGIGWVFSCPAGLLRLNLAGTAASTVISLKTIQDCAACRKHDEACRSFSGYTNNTSNGSAWAKISLVHLETLVFSFHIRRISHRKDRPREVRRKRVVSLPAGDRVPHRQEAKRLQAREEAADLVRRHPVYHGVHHRRSDEADELAEPQPLAHHRPPDGNPGDVGARHPEPPQQDERVQAERDRDNR